jgi:2-phosphosulfolactate phosphatase
MGVLLSLISTQRKDGMTAQVVLTPRDLKSADVVGRTVVVFDVLRATTTMAAALAAGAAGIRVFDSLDKARAAAGEFAGPKVLCGELNCLQPPGFDLGNSPRQWDQFNCKGITVFMATTNGTRALAAAAKLKPGMLLAGAVVNAKVVAHAAVAAGTDVTLLCAGTGGEASFEDLIGAGAVLSELQVATIGDAAVIASRLFEQARGDLPAALRCGTGGDNLLRVGLEADIDYCANVNWLSIVGQLDIDPLIVRSL